MNEFLVLIALPFLFGLAGSRIFGRSICCKRSLVSLWFLGGAIYCMRCGRWLAESYGDWLPDVPGMVILAALLLLVMGVTTTSRWLLASSSLSANAYFLWLALVLTLQASTSLFDGYCDVRGSGWQVAAASLGLWFLYLTVGIIAPFLVWSSVKNLRGLGPTWPILEYVLLAVLLSPAFSWAFREPSFWPFNSMPPIWIIVLIAYGISTARLGLAIRRREHLIASACVLPAGLFAWLLFRHEMIQKSFWIGELNPPWWLRFPAHWW